MNEIEKTTAEIVWMVSHAAWIFASAVVGRLFAFLDRLIQGHDYRPYIGTAIAILLFACLSFRTSRRLPSSSWPIVCAVWSASAFVGLPMILQFVFK